MNKKGFVLLLSFSLILLSPLVPAFADEAADTPSEDTPTGQLKIDSQHVEHLVLVDDQGHRKEFEKPTETLNLPSGKYRIEQVRLTGGYQCYAFTVQGLEWITVSTDEVSTMKFGPPLTQDLKVTRQGKMIKLEYLVKGTAGETYRLNRDNPPEFAVYKNDKKIASGKFEFG